MSEIDRENTAFEAYDVHPSIDPYARNININSSTRVQFELSPSDINHKEQLVHTESEGFSLKQRSD